MTMKQYSDEAQAAHAHLVPMLSQAIDEAQARLEKAKIAASTETLRPDLEAMLDTAETPPADAVDGILSGYLQLMPAHRAREGDLLIRSLVSTKKHHGLSDTQAGRIAGAIIGAIKGKGYGLVEWPQDWHVQLNNSDIRQWCEWVTPEEYAKLSASLDAHTQARISAESDLVQLGVSRQALADMVPTPSDGALIKIRNNADNRQGVSGIQWQSGEVKELAPTDYARVTQNAGYQRLAESGLLEVMA